MSKPVARHAHHAERHFTGGEVVRDTVLGMADGLTVPFALAAGLTGAIESTKLIVTAGIAEIAAGSIAMGLGGYLAARSQAEHYVKERHREQAEVREKPAAEMAEITDIFADYGISPEESAPVVQALRRHPQAWIDFMMRFELGLERPEPRRALVSAATIGGAYVAGGLIPLVPYMTLGSAGAALGVSAGVTLVALAAFGYVKGRFTGLSPVRSAIQTVLIGSIAASAAFVLARLIS
ncbi:MAG TPA: VIT1/CCC1 transporter family protein [Methylomirabilota bacterium]|nr:VIT1/CCC1 transporter family protein [Methylomirabilota bacterium]